MGTTMHMSNGGLNPGTIMKKHVAAPLPENHQSEFQ